MKNLSQPVIFLPPGKARPHDRGGENKHTPGDSTRWLVEPAMISCLGVDVKQARRGMPILAWPRALELESSTGQDPRRCNAAWAASVWDASGAPFARACNNVRAS